MSPNVHNLIHLCDDVRNLGSLDSFSAYPFENYLQIIKNLIRKSAKPLQQIVKRLSEHEMAKIVKPTESEENVLLYDEHFNGPTIPNICGKQFKKANVKKWKLSKCQPDNCVYLNDMSVLLIENFVKRNQQMLIIARKFELYEDLYTMRSGVNSSVKSSQLGIHVVKQLSNLCTWDISEIYCKGFIVPSFIPPDGDSFVVSPLLAQTYGLC